MISRRAMLDAAMTLPPDERADLVKEIWDSLAMHREAVKLTESQEEELEQCWREYQVDPTAGDDWATTKARIVGRRA